MGGWEAGCWRMRTLKAGQMRKDHSLDWAGCTQRTSPEPETPAEYSLICSSSPVPAGREEEGAPWRVQLLHPLLTTSERLQGLAPWQWFKSLSGTKQGTGSGVSKPSVEPHSNYLRLCGPLSQVLQVLLKHKTHERQRVWLSSNNIWFTGTEMWISYNFSHVRKYSLVFQPFKHAKSILGSYTQLIL